MEVFEEVFVLQSRLSAPLSIPDLRIKDQGFEASPINERRSTNSELICPRKQCFCSVRTTRLDHGTTKNMGATGPASRGLNRAMGSGLNKLLERPRIGSEQLYDLCSMF